MCPSACLGESLGEDGQLPHEQKVQRHRFPDLRPLHLHSDFAAAVLLRQPCAIHLHNHSPHGCQSAENATCRSPLKWACSDAELCIIANGTCASLAAGKLVLKSSH